MTLYLCRPDWYGPEDGGMGVKAESAEAAACEFCRHRDSVQCEYPDDQKVIVRHPDGHEETVEVWAESVREYWVPRKRGAFRGPV
jgi:hypothetical protein